MELSKANDLLNPGYLAFESGYFRQHPCSRSFALIRHKPQTAQ
jgi:hypothetical protein